MQRNKRKIEIVLKSAIKKIEPTKSEEENALNLSKKIISQLNSVLSDCEASLGGSGAKATWLKGEFDIDIFVKFPYEKYKDKSDKLSDILEKAIKEIYPNFIRLHGSRDYFQIDNKDIKFELIPVLFAKNNEHILNVTDASPLHAIWINKNIKGLTKEVRLLKAFCKASFTYGAESYIAGFSGYCCELLIINYGSFQNVLINSLKWKNKEIIDPAKHYKKKIANLNSARIQGPIIIIDPVQKERNAAAALSLETLKKFKKSAEMFLKKPSAKFFEKKPIKLSDIKKEDTLVIEILPESSKHDVMGQAIKSYLNFFIKNMEHQGFSIKFADMQYLNGIGLIWIKFNEKTLPKTHRIAGPPIAMLDHCDNFRRKYKETMELSGRLYANVKRKHTTVLALAKEIIKEKYPRISRVLIK